MRKLSEDYVGTCQACFGEFKVSDNRTVVLHGYSRPGSGYVVGECSGTGHPPFEYDATLSRSILAAHEAHIVSLKKYVDDLLSGRIDKLERRYTEYKTEGVRKRIPVQMKEQIGKESVHWVDEAKKAQYGAEADIRYFERVAAYIRNRVEKWSPGTIVGIDTPPTGKIRGVRDAYDPDEAEQEERRVAERAERQAKPGKLRLTLFWDAEARGNIPDDEMKKIKAWVKSTFSAGKQRVTEGYDFSEVPRAVRRINDRNRFVVVVNIDWSYIDGVHEVIPNATRIDHATKKVEYYADMTETKPWNE